MNMIYKLEPNAEPDFPSSTTADEKVNNIEFARMITEKEGQSDYCTIWWNGEKVMESSPILAPMAFEEMVRHISGGTNGAITPPDSSSKKKDIELIDLDRLIQIYNDNTNPDGLELRLLIKNAIVEIASWRGLDIDLQKIQSHEKR